MRIVTRPDFDGIVCAVFLLEAIEDINEPIKWTEPSDLQKGLVQIKKGDILANLPYHKNCSLWFDHHCSNKIDTPFEGAFELLPSAASIIFKYYKNIFKKDYSELVKHTDKIDSAALSYEEVLNPENDPYILLSMTISGRDKNDEWYWNKVVNLLRTNEIYTIMKDSDVKKQCEEFINQNKKYKDFLLAHTKIIGEVSITDFTEFEMPPSGNRFLIYSLFPESIVNVKIRYDDNDKDKVIVSVGESIFNRKCNVNIGEMLAKFEGGGHRSVGACRFHINKKDEYIPKIIEILVKNNS
ncbi:MAG: exopolyphosphatase [Desulfobacterales bacterium]|nr:exopolyphosphatase [Desulfobacterales bacterium]